MSEVPPQTIVIDASVLFFSSTLRSETLLATFQNLKDAGIKIFIAFDFRDSHLSHRFAHLASTCLAKNRDNALMQNLPMDKTLWPKIHFICSEDSSFVSIAKQKGLRISTVGKFTDSEVEDILCGIFGEGIRALKEEPKKSATDPTRVHRTGQMEFLPLQEKTGWRAVARRLGQRLHLVRPSESHDSAAKKQKVG